MEQPQPSPVDLAVAIASYREERAAEYLYRVAEQAETGKYAEMFARLRTASAHQAGIWEDRVRAAGGVVEPFRPNTRHHVVAALVRGLGVRRTLPVLAAMKVRGLAAYRDGAITPATELVVAPQHESWHRAGGSGGALRAAVFGINDGLVSNAGLIIGLAGAGSGTGVILIGGVAGLLAGGFSMAAGEYISVRTQRELFEYQIAIEWNEIQTMPEEETEELAVIYEAKGLAPAEARMVAERLLADPQRGLDTLAREELGLDPQGLGSPMVAAGSSFLSFALGAFIPVVPYLVLTGTRALAGSIAAMEISLLVVGGLISLFTGRSALWSALRMALIGSAAAVVTYLIGHLFGVSIQ